ncbi:glycosyltransferase family 4 protein [Pseudoroseicyclus sp. CXY001]|uniref:glycosyltransferase family 4 protein n=1 Tax=Pseudoroseicyclus sp. CXY001 TaxID=3242492 RepID=UPI003571572C
MKRLLILQYGDVRAALRAFAEGRQETYYDQRRSVGFWTDRAAAGTEITIAYPVDEAAYREVVSTGLTCVGVPSRHFYDGGLGGDLIETSRAEAVIVGGPHLPMLTAARAAGLPVYANFADVFRPLGFGAVTRREGLRRAREHWRLRRLLGAPNVTAIGNHSLGASRSLHEVLRLPKARITPWEWTPFPTVPRVQPFCEDGLRLVYAGTLSEAKGVGDLLRAVALLRDGGAGVTLTLFGEGQDRLMLEEEANRLQLGRAVRFEGLQPNDVVRAAMAGADAVTVPSRPAYAEALPNVISEALSVGTPLVISDHPAFAFRFTPGEAALVAPPADPGALARTLGRLLREPGLAEALSSRTAEVLAGLRFGSLWYDLMQAFLDDPTDKTGWVARHSLAALERR